VSRSWEQEEEVYRRLASEMASLEKRGFPRTGSRTSLSGDPVPSMPPKLAPGATPPLPPLAAVPRPVPIGRSASVQAALDHPSWEQEEARGLRPAAARSTLCSTLSDASRSRAARKCITGWQTKLQSSSLAA